MLAEQPVIAGTAAQHVVIAFAEESIRAVVPVESVIAGAARNSIVTGAAVQRVPPGKPVETIIAAEAEQNIRGRGADQRLAAVVSASFSHWTPGRMWVTADALFGAPRFGGVNM